MSSSRGYGDGIGWRAVFDRDAWIQALLVAIVWVVFHSALACAVALVRDTRGHDWYATGKVTLTELMIGIGFDDGVVTEYRDYWGEVESLTRAEMRNKVDAWWKRRHVLRTARQSAELGACCGLGGALLCLTVFGRRARREAPRPVPESPGRAAEDQTQVSNEREPASERDSGKGAGKSGARSTKRRKLRKRDYGRWI